MDYNKVINELQKVYAGAAQLEASAALQKANASSLIKLLQQEVAGVSTPATKKQRRVIDDASRTRTLHLSAKRFTKRA